MNGDGEKPGEKLRNELSMLRLSLGEMSPLDPRYAETVREIRRLRGIEAPSVYDCIPQPEAAP